MHCPCKTIGYAAYIKVLDIPLEQWRRMLEGDTLGPLLVIKQFIGPMLERRSGSIINISSGSGAHGRAGNQPYGAAKAAFTNWSQSLAAELAEHNIAVNVVFPTATRTTGYAEWTQLYEQRTGARAAARFYTPESVVPVVVMLAQQDAHLTGRIFPVEHWNLEHGLGGPEVWAS